MNLLVIESTGKEATIKKYLGSDWEVFATKGHVRDLPEKTMGLDQKNNFAPQYVIMPDKEQTVKRLKQKAQKADLVYLATDPDREGEAISWHLAYILGYDNEKMCRVEFNEITKDVILRALTKPRKINLDLVDAQQTRRVLDRLVGYKISPILCKKLGKNLSAGRVQSVALKLVVDRERDILNFKPEEYWTIQAELEKEGAKPKFKAQLATFKGKKLKIKNQAEKDEIVKNLSQNFVVDKVEKKVSLSHAPAPFTTSGMQQDASNKLNFSTAMTTRIAQELYEGVELGNEGKIALVTYIRTDSVRVSEEAQAKAKIFIQEKYGKEFFPSKPNIYKTKGNAQDAHEAIRPTHLERTPESIKQYVKPECYKLYKLIYERFLASQMSQAEYNQVNCEISNGDYGFKASGKTLKFAGYTAVYQNYEEKEDKDEKDAKLPVLDSGDYLKLLNLIPEQKFTKPTPRFTEATLVDQMEKNGIGRPATYAAIISVLYNRKYVEKEGKALKPTELGFNVNDMLQKYFADIMNVKFTSNMETKLDEIAEGEKEWTGVISNFYQELLPELRNANLDRDKTEQKVYEVSDVPCSKCGAMMVIKEGKFGKFLACPNYPKCKNIQSINPAKIVGICPKCGKNLLERKSKRGTNYYACEDYKDCKFMSWDLPLNEPCPKCGCYTLLKTNKKGVFKGCSNPDCDYFEKVADVNKNNENSTNDVEPA